MTAHRLVPVVIAVIAAGVALLVAQDCDSADWLQAVTGLGAPVVAGAGAGLAAARASPRLGVPIGIGVGFAVAVVTLLGSLLVWVGECSR